ncbi:MAG TPA: hypothetical protein VGA37_01155 [Gemmatimonadales bacterium]
MRRRIESRIEALRPDAPRQWGRMTSDQMLWHVNQFLTFALGEGTFEPQKSPMPLPILRFALLYLPWPKGAPTHRSAVANAEYDFEAERARCKALIDRFVSRPIDGPWPVDPVFGKVTGKFTSKLQAKHLDHHFRQFGG